MMDQCRNTVTDFDNFSMRRTMPTSHSMGYTSKYSRFVAAASVAHTKQLLRLALSGSVMQIEEKRVWVPPLNKEDARDLVQDTFRHFLRGIKERNPKVMELISQNAPESRSTFYFLSKKLRYLAMDFSDKRNRYQVGSELPKGNAGEEMESAADSGGYLERLSLEDPGPLHNLPKNPESEVIDDESSPLNRLIKVFSQAHLAGAVKPRDQEVFRLLLRETVGEVTDHEAAAQLGVTRKRYQNLKSEVKRTLRNFHSTRKGDEYV